MRLIRLLKQDIYSEAKEWAEQDIISRDQADAIARYYDIDPSGRQQHAIGYKLLMILGYLFIGLSLITLIGANWDDIPRALRMTGLILLTGLTQGFAGWQYYKYRGGTELFFLGNLFYGASIILIAQIYHLGEHMPDGVFWWALGTLPIGLLLGNSWLMLQSLTLAVIWFLLESSMGFYPTLFPIFLLPALYLVITGPSNLLLFITTLSACGLFLEYLLAHFWATSPQTFYFGAEHIGFSLAFFLVLYPLSHWLRQLGTTKAQDYAATIAIWSLRFLLVYLMIMSYESSWEAFIDAQWARFDTLLVVLLGMGILSLYLASKTDRLLRVGALQIGLLSTLLLTVYIVTPDHVLYLVILTNLVLIGFAVSLILKGIHQGISHYFYLGILVVLITALLRYIDLVGDYIGAAVLFMIFAAILLGAAKYWQKYGAAQ